MQEERTFNLNTPKFKSQIWDHKTYSLPSNKNSDDKELKLDSPNPKFTFQCDDKSRGLVGQQLYNEKSAVVCFDTHSNAESPVTRSGYLLCLTSTVSSLLSNKIEYFSQNTNLNLVGSCRCESV